MFIGRCYRKKRKVLLSSLPTPQKKRLAMSWQPPMHNARGRDHHFWQACYNAHASYCGCGSFLSHLVRLEGRYASGNNNSSPQAGAPPVIRRALPPPAAPDQPQTPQWPGTGGGDGAGEGGQQGGGGGDDYAPEDLDALFDAVAGDQQ